MTNKDIADARRDVSRKYGSRQSDDLQVTFGKFTTFATGIELMKVPTKL